MADSGRWFLIGVFLATLIFLAGHVNAAPQSYITEEALAGYFWNGTLSGGIARTGYVQVDTGTTEDVLQQIRLDISGTEGTNLQSATAYRNVAASPNLPDDRTLIYVNTTNSTEDLSYQITNLSMAPVISMRLDWGNLAGGKDIRPGGNALLFNVTLNASEALAPVSMVMQGKKDTYGWNDSVNFTSASAPSGSVQIFDTDMDGFNDRVIWTGPLPQGDFTIQFNGTITPGSNFDESQMQVNLDDGQSYSIHTRYQTFTGKTFSSRFSRGPVREGVEMLEAGTWTVRGFIKNIASNLSYTLHGWELYEIGNPTPVLSSSLSSYMLPGETRYTGWYDTGISDKPAYYSGSFDWEIIWGQSLYTGTSRSSMTMPAIYEMDLWADGTATLQSNSDSGRSVMVNITSRHLGYSGIHVNSFILNSTLPRLSQSGEAKTWTPSSVRVYYSNGSRAYDITPFVTAQTQDSGAGDGFVYAELNDIFSALGHYMEQNDDIILSFMASSPASSQNQNYTFTSNATLITLSGTPVTKAAGPSLVIPGIVIPVEPGGGGGGGGPPPAPYADIVKESADAYFITANTVKVIVVAGITDSGDKGIKDVKVLAYAPKEAELDSTSFSMRIYRNSAGRWEEMKSGSDFMVVDRGLTKIGKEEYREYLIKRTTPYGEMSERTIDMKGGDKIEVIYKEKVPFGTSYLLTRISGYSYYEDRLIFEDANIPVRREIGKIERMQIEESEWEQGEAAVGKPVRWKKIFRVFNPNNVSIEDSASTRVFQDSLAVEIWEAGKQEREGLSIKSEGRNVSVTWHALLKAGERKTYIMEASTPPVLETKREAGVIESNKTSVKLSINLTLENFAKEAYSNVTFLFPAKRDKILWISDPEAEIEEVPESGWIKIKLRDMAGLSSREISIIYVETPPMIATFLSALKYSCNDYAKITILVVPSESETNSYIETEVIGPEPNLITTHAEILDLKSAKPYEETRIPMIVRLSSFPTGKYFVYTRFRKDFGTILSDSREFFVDCPEMEAIHISWILVLGISAGIVAMLALRVYRKRSFEKETEELRKKVRKI